MHQTQWHNAKKKKNYKRYLNALTYTDKLAFRLCSNTPSTALSTSDVLPFNSPNKPKQILLLASICYK